MDKITIEIDAHTLERLEELRDQVAHITDRGALSPRNVVSLLLDHWRTATPKREWIQNQGGLYPGKGGTRWPHA